MPITSGATIGPYKVDREIGRGGMGVVFLARDTRLGRTVALKALPDDVASDPDRLQRFEREARVLASLNHPNVASIYGLEEREGRRYLALEHVEGETLAHRIARGPLPLAEAVDLAIQIAAGMEAAHDAGVVHRDLKPGNVMVTPADQVKILDFGLAKGRVATDEAGLAKSPALIDSPATASSPTLTSPAFPDSPTLPGVILGTAAYLSPEQARGKTVDRRTDIWSFGCVLYECLTGKRAFQAETTSDLIAKILEHDPDWAALPRNTPPLVRALLERCLTKDPKRRLRDIGEARLTLEEIKSGRHSTAGGGDAGAAPTARRATVLATIAALAIGAALGALAWSMLAPSHKSSTGMIHLAINLPANTLPLDGLIAPDGKKVVMLAIPHGQGEDTRPRIYVRRMDQESFAPLAGTEGAAPGITVSPDSRWIAFRAPASEQSTRIRVFKVPIDGSSPPVAIADAADNWVFPQGSNQMAWLDSGNLLIVANNGASYVLLPSGGGAPTPPRDFVASGTERFSPRRCGLPGDRGALLDALSYEGGVYRRGVSFLDLKTGKVKSLIRDGGSPTYLPPYLLFTRQDALFAVRFDLQSLEIKGEPVALIGGIRLGSTWAHAEYTLASNGTVGYLGGGRAREGRHLVILDRNGKESDWSGERRGFEFGITVSPDGNRCLASINNADAITEVWVSERGRAAMRRIPTRPGADCGSPIWSPDGQRVAYFEGSLGPKDGVYLATIDGSAPARLLTATHSRSEYLVPTSWSPDGSWIAVTCLEGRKVTPCVIPASQASGAPVVPRRLFNDDVSRGGWSFSPDGRKVAYISMETGKPEVIVGGWANGALTGNPVPVSAAQPSTPRWSQDSKHLYIRTTHEKIAEVDIVEAPHVTGSPAHLTATRPRDVWDMVALRVAPSQLGSLYDILPDGRLLAAQSPEEEYFPTQAEILLNVTDEIEKRMKAAGK